MGEGAWVCVSGGIIDHSLFSSTDMTEFDRCLVVEHSKQESTTVSCWLFWFCYMCMMSSSLHCDCQTCITQPNFSFYLNDVSLVRAGIGSNPTPHTPSLFGMHVWMICQQSRNFSSSPFFLNLNTVSLGKLHNSGRKQIVNQTKQKELKREKFSKFHNLAAPDG